MGQSVMRRGTSRPTIQNDNSGSEKSWVHWRIVRPSQWCGTDYLCEGHKEANTSYDEPKCHIVISGKRDIVGVEGKTDISKDYEKFHEIPPFKVKADPSILINDEDYSWLRRNKQMTQAKKKWRLSPATIMMIPCQLCNWRVWYHCPFCTCKCYVGQFMIPCQLSTFSYFIWNALMSYGLALVIIKNSNNKYFVVSRNKIK